MKVTMTIMLAHHMHGFIYRLIGAQEIHRCNERRGSPDQKQ